SRERSAGQAEAHDQCQQDAGKFFQFAHVFTPLHDKIERLGGQGLPETATGDGLSRLDGFGLFIPPSPSQGFM
ncbi:MAG: hypothetical protein LIO70_01090, partial [Clostridiales bacterium]|nr:hypothetical protein [Clostridiales bacterium]